MTPAIEDQMKCLYLTSDLMFSSRVCSLARDAGRRVEVVGSPAALSEGLGGGDVGLVVIDLTQRANELVAIVQSVKSSGEPAKIIAYGPHVDEAMLQAAAAAGCDEVLPRSQFNAQITQILTGLLPETDS